VMPKDHHILGTQESVEKGSFGAMSVPSLFSLSTFSAAP
jgi:hypothetical protein